MLPDLVELCRSNDFTDLVVVHEHKGEPDGMVISHMPFGPTAYFISSTVMRHDIKDEDIGTVSEANPHLILENFTTALGKRTANILKHLFAPPKGKSKRVITFAKQRGLDLAQAPHVRDAEGSEERPAHGGWTEVRDETVPDQARDDRRGGRGRGVGAEAVHAVGEEEAAVREETRVIRELSSKAAAVAHHL